MNRFLLITAMMMLCVNSCFAQFTLSTPDNNSTLQIGGLMSAYYNYRLLKPGENDNKHDEPGLKDAELDFVGQTKGNFIYELKMNFAQLTANAVSGGVAQGTDASGLKSAYVLYVGCPVHIKLGWDKLPYSQSAMTDVYESPYWSHDLLTGGDMFSNRDMGLTLSSSLWKERINIYGGAYSGLGDYFLYNGDNDASGQPEYVGRIDVSYPSRYDYKQIDEKGVPIPKFRVGANIRYTDKTQPAGNTIPSGIIGDYGLNIINGQKMIYGFDFSGEYRHFSIQLESDAINMHPASGTDPLFNGTAADVNHGVVHAGGWTGTINYDCKKLRSVFSVKYENVNLNDLVPGSQQNLYIGYAYQVNRFRSCIKVEWVRPLQDDNASDPIKYTDNFRIGYQIMFDNETYEH